MKITADIFSGRENPSFELSYEEFESVLLLISKQKPASGISLFDGLGFRGFILENHARNLIVVQADLAKIIFGETIKYYAIDSSIIKLVAQLFRSKDIEHTYDSLLQEVLE